MLVIYTPAPGLGSLRMPSSSVVVPPTQPTQGSACTCLLWELLTMQQHDCCLGEPCHMGQGTCCTQLGTCGRSVSGEMFSCKPPVAYCGCSIPCSTLHFSSLHSFIWERCIFIRGVNASPSADNPAHQRPTDAVLLSNTWQNACQVVWVSRDVSQKHCRFQLWHCFQHFGCQCSWKLSQKGCLLNCQRVNDWHEAQVLFMFRFWHATIGLFPDKCHPILPDGPLRNMPTCVRNGVDAQCHLLVICASPAYPFL